MVNMLRARQNIANVAIMHSDRDSVAVLLNAKNRSPIFATLTPKISSPKIKIRVSLFIVFGSRRLVVIYCLVLSLQCARLYRAGMRYV